MFALNDKDPGTANHEGVRIRFKEGMEAPACMPTRPTPPHKREQLKKHIYNMLKYNIIEPSRSPWGANVMLVPKKGGDTRLVVDMRALNAKTVGMSYPLVRINDALDTLAGSSVFSVVDANQSYYQLPMVDKEPTAFRCYLGSFHFKKMPMGLKNSGPIYQEWMDRCLGSLKWEICCVYLDDCIIFSKSVEQHFVDLQKVFDVFQENGIHLKAKKCEFFRSSLGFLGHIVDKNGVRPDPNKVRCILEANPTTKKEIHSWVSTAGYYRRHVPNFSRKVQPLYDLIKSKSRISPKGLTKQQKECIEIIKKWLTTAPILAYPQWDKQFSICTDASTQALGAVLEQTKDDGSKVAVMYISRALKSHEKSYHIYELEILALVWAISVFKHYLFKKFQVWTDNKAMTWLKLKRDSPNKRIAQWIINLESYDFEINHRTSRQNANADGPTRFNVMPADTNYGEKVDLTCSLEDFDPEPTPDEHYEHFEPDFGFSVDSEEQEELFLNSVQDAYSIPDLEDLIKEQKKDPQLVKIRDLLNKGEQKEDFPFLIEDGLVKRRTPNPHKFKRKVSKKFKFCHQIVVPDNKEIRQGIFSLYHNHLISAHNGSAKVIQLLQEKFYWKNMALISKGMSKHAYFVQNERHLDH